MDAEYISFRHNYIITLSIVEIKHEIMPVLFYINSYDQQEFYLL